MATILVSAGDLSGEAHAAALVRAVRARRPGDRFVGLGGERMRAAGVEIVVERGALASGGLVELIPELVRIVGAWIRLGRVLREADPDVVVLVDSGGFNLPFARRVRRESRARILYFVAPQVWAWRPGRLARLAARVDRIVVCLPFERDWYAQRGVEVDYFGHPLLDALAASDGAPRQPGEAPERKRSARERHGLPQDRPLLGLFPGSRWREVERQLPLMLDAYHRLRASASAFARTVAVIGVAEGLPEAAIREIAVARGARATGEPDVRTIATGSGSVFDALDVALIKPGSVTLEAALRGLPMVVVGRANRVSAWLLRRSLRVRSVGLPNLLADAPFVPECLQEEATPERVVAALSPLFAGPERARQLAGLAQIAERLGPAGAIDRTADVVEALLATARA